LELEDINLARHQTSWFYINDNISMRANIPSR
jgi:hypothetical protein